MFRTIRHARTGAILLSVVLGVACTTEASRKRANVLVICVDVLRADHVGSYGYPRATTPAIDALARSGVVFESAFSPAGWTKPSVPSYLTGRFPHQHGVYMGSWEQDGKMVSDSLSPGEHTLAELFKGAGYQTVAVVTNRQISAKFGFAQGFDQYHEQAGAAREIRRRFLDWLEQADRAVPFFAYLHFLDVHLPYDPPEDYRTAFGAGRAAVDFSSGTWKLLQRRIRAGEVHVSKADRQTMIDLYDGELLYTDTQIGEVVRALEERGLLNNTLIVVLSDHGEEFLERGGIGHGTSLYDELLRVPLIFRFPGATPAGVQVTEPVSLVDVVPTLVEYFGLEQPPDLAGRSILALASGRPAPSGPPLYAEGIHGSRYQQAVRSDGWKYIVTVPVDKNDSRRAKHHRAKLQEGRRVEVEGMMAEDGAFLVEEVEIKGNQADGDDKVTGPIEAIAPGGAVLTVLGYRVRLDPQVKVEDHLEATIDREALRVGDVIKVYGRALSPTDFAARTLKLLDPSHRKKQKLEGGITGPLRQTADERIFKLVEREVRVHRGSEFVFPEHKAVVPSAARRVDPWQEALESKRPLQEELYHVAMDPGEQRDLSQSHPEKLHQMRSVLRQLRTTVTTTPAPVRELDDGDLETLRRLGYIE